MAQAGNKKDSRGTHAVVADARNVLTTIGIRDGVTGLFKLVPRDQAALSVFDSNFLIGDGIWTGAESQTSEQILEAFKGPKCYMSSQHWTMPFPTLALRIFNPLIIPGYVFGNNKTFLMATPQAAVATATLTAISIAVMVHTLHSPETRIASLTGVYLMGFYNVPWVFTVSLSSFNTGEATKKSLMGITCAVICWQHHRPTVRQLPTYPLGIGAMLFAFALMAVAGIVYYGLCIIENKRKTNRMA
ncbi:major facilitator superfamily transporter [Stagonosporopsis vannaccii]|nr:major facilitator superfamily transporter [Stagonosporopsis vannaccii]